MYAPELDSDVGGGHDSMEIVLVHSCSKQEWPVGCCRKQGDGCIRNGEGIINQKVEQRLSAILSQYIQRWFGTNHTVQQWSAFNTLYKSQA